MKYKIKKLNIDQIITPCLNLFMNFLKKVGNNLKKIFFSKS